MTDVVFIKTLLINHVSADALTTGRTIYQGKYKCARPSP